MDRRRLLCGAAGLLAGVGLAGCTGGQGEVPVTAEPPPPGVGGGEESGDGAIDGDGDADGTGGSSTGDQSVSITDFNVLEADDGTVVATVTVSNDSERRQVRLARARITIENAETVAERFVTVSAGASATVRIPVDVGYQAWLNGGSYVPELVDRTPATPLPTAGPTPGEPTAETADSQTGTPESGGSPTRTPGTDTRSETGTKTPGDSSTDGTGTGT
jgi:hypothetical protein